jgi:hypothetical protein
MLNQRVCDAIADLPEAAWIKAICVDETQRKHSQVCEITDRVDLSAWPQGSRLIARRTELRAGDQQSFADHDGYRLAVVTSARPRTAAWPTCRSARSRTTRSGCCS